MNHALTLPGIGDLVDGRFRINRKLGEGGTSTVYEVSHVITDRKFAIKWLLPELALEDAAVDRFIHEARVGSKFAHPHAVQVFDICKANDSFYMLMELLEGESLQARLERVGRLEVQQACAIVVTCADVLSAAHRVGIIHRDLKPANIFLCLCNEGDAPEVPKLLDFGISTFCSDLQSLSLTATPRGSVIGTPLYMSPEQMLSKPVDTRADIYALGAVLYELVSGHPPYHADSYGELVVKVTVEARPTPLQQIAPVDRQFAAVVAKAMARDACDRFATVEELIAALRPYVGTLESSTIRTISAPATQQRLDSQHELRPVAHPAKRTSVRVRRTGVMAGMFAVVGATVATVGASFVDRSSRNHSVSTSSAATSSAATSSAATSSLSRDSVDARSGTLHPTGSSSPRPMGTGALVRVSGAGAAWEAASRASEVGAGRPSVNSRAHGVEPAGPDRVASKPHHASHTARDARRLPSKRTAKHGDAMSQARGASAAESAQSAVSQGPASPVLSGQSHRAVPSAPTAANIAREDFSAFSADAKSGPPQVVVSRDDF